MDAAHGFLASGRCRSLIGLLGFTADAHAAVIEVEPLTKFRHPTNLLGGISDQQSVIWYCSGDHSSSADKCK